MAAKAKEHSPNLEETYRRSSRLKTAWHEVLCVECRVSWKSWLRRLRGDYRGFNTRDFG